MNQITKGLTENVLITFDFTKYKELSSGETILTANFISCPVSLVFGTPTINGALVSVRISGGLVGTNHTASCKITTSGGGTRIGDGRVLVLADCNE